MTSPPTPPPTDPQIFSAASVSQLLHCSPPLHNISTVPPPPRSHSLLFIICSSHLLCCHPFFFFFYSLLIVWPNPYSSFFGKSALSSSSSSVHLFSNDFFCLRTSFTFFSALPTLSSFFSPWRLDWTHALLSLLDLTCLSQSTVGLAGERERKRSGKKDVSRGSQMFPQTPKKYTGVTETRFDNIFSQDALYWICWWWSISLCKSLSFKRVNNKNKIK